jgi:hypothetical protein
MQGETTEIKRLRADLKRLEERLDEEYEGRTRALQERNAALAERDQVLKRMTAAEHKLLDYEGKPMLFSQRQRLTELEALRGAYETACFDRECLQKRRDDLEARSQRSEEHRTLARKLVLLIESRRCVAGDDLEAMLAEAEKTAAALRQFEWADAHEAEADHA